MLAIVRSLSLIAVLFVSLAPSQAKDSYPNRTVKLITPFGPGSSTDALTRLVGNALSERFGTPFVVENRTGAYGLIACRELAAAAPDGYTLGVIPDGPLTTIPSAFAAFDKTPICLPTDLRPIGFLADVPFVIVVRADLPVHSLAELIAYLKARPGALKFGAPHPTGTLGIALLETLGARVLRIPYPTEPNAWVQGILTGTIDGMFSTLFTARGQVAAGKARALAILARSRSPHLPNVPTVAEAGFPELDAFPTWMGFFGPKRLPDHIERLLSEAVLRILREPSFQEKVRAIMLQPRSSLAAELAAQIAEQNRDMTAFIREKKLDTIIGR